MTTPGLWDVGDRTKDLEHARQAFYLPTPSPSTARSLSADRKCKDSDSVCSGMSMDSDSCGNNDHSKKLRFLGQFEELHIQYPNC